MAFISIGGKRGEGRGDHDPGLKGEPNRAEGLRNLKSQEKR